MATSPLDYIPKINTGPNAGGLPPALLKQTATSLAGALRGELPQDVQDLLRQQAAEYGVASGMGGSQFAAYAGLRNLGLTSLDRIKGAENILGNQFITPGQSQQLALDAGKTRAGIAQNQFELEQRGEIERNRLAQQQREFSGGQDIKREELGQRGTLAALEQSGANYRASLGLGGEGSSRGGSRGGGGSAGFSSFVGGGSGSGVAYNPGTDPNIGLRGGLNLDPNYAPNFNTGPTNYDYNPYNDGGYDDGYGGVDDFGYSEDDYFYGGY